MGGQREHNQEPHVEQQPGGESVDPELDGQAAREVTAKTARPRSPRLHLPRRSRRLSPARRAGRRETFPHRFPISTWVTLCHQEHGENDGDEVLLFVRLDDKEPSKNKRAAMATPHAYVQLLAVGHEHLLHLAFSPNPSHQSCSRAPDVAIWCSAWTTIGKPPCPTSSGVQWKPAERDLAAAGRAQSLPCDREGLRELDHRPRPLVLRPARARSRISFSLPCRAGPVVVRTFTRLFLGLDSRTPARLQGPGLAR